ncbi:MAG: chain-length determining protein [Brevundimonas sp.]|uniref:Wzz/FepE/Etk N-terminal domain-containing protein n=1 Tax=Brevundimonas sp. TaxID=1871086 RepID=UPI000DAF60DA|nr:Wzz/FepE/Etk N-terminal domain-containing protein [Brevundimonas sp.]PZU73204.1 MAG: chain-length determining protein [Brevundimonas sp.]
MNKPILKYHGPGDFAASSDTTPRWRRTLGRTPLSFLLVVIAPTILVAIYYLLVASPQYTSEARFVVRSKTQEQPSSLGVALQGVGLSSNQTDAYAVHEYIRSRNALDDLRGKLDVRAMLGRPGVDALSRYPRPWESESPDGLHDGFRRFVTVGYDSSTGLSTLRVRAFRPQDAQTLADALLDGGERLVNQLNTRADQGAVADARRNVADAEARLTAAQVRLTTFRNREGLLDPSKAAVENLQLIGNLRGTVANLRAERSQLASEAPQSPQLTALDSRIAAFERQIAAEQSKMAGTADSLAPKLETYEALALDREYADKALASARALLDRSESDARSQRLYLERVVRPNLPTDASQPKRLLAILTVFLSLLVLYATAYLVVAGLREHSQG